eukprot:3858100-Prorocentrum_lima.AAC.1
MALHSGTNTDSSCLRLLFLDLGGKYPHGLRSHKSIFVKVAITLSSRAPPWISLRPSDSWPHY